MSPDCRQTRRRPPTRALWVILAALRDSGHVAPVRGCIFQRIVADTERGRYSLGELLLVSGAVE